MIDCVFVLHMVLLAVAMLLCSGRHTAVSGAVSGALSGAWLWQAVLLAVPFGLSGAASSDASGAFCSMSCGKQLCRVESARHERASSVWFMF